MASSGSDDDHGSLNDDDALGSNSGAVDSDGVAVDSNSEAADSDSDVPMGIASGDSDENESPQSKRRKVQVDAVQPLDSED